MNKNINILLEGLEDFWNDYQDNLQDDSTRSADQYYKPLREYHYFPETKEELQDIIIKRVEKEGPNVDLNDINTSKITDMSRLFQSYSFNNFDGGLTEWDVSNVKDMSFMFYECKNFDCDLSKWDVSNVTDMSRMFDGCISFEGKGLENWDVSNVINTPYMFCDCEKLNIDFSKWDVSKVWNMDEMFRGCDSFEGKGLEAWSDKLLI